MRILLIFLYVFAAVSVFGQKGGSAVFDFVNVPNSARVTALGGAVYTIKDKDLSLFSYNPALIDSVSIDNKVTATFGSLFAAQTGITNGYAAYGTSLKSFPLLIGISYLNYGSFERTNEFGDKLGEFGANDIMISISSSLPVTEKISVGTAIKPVYSQISKYNANAILADLGAVYNDTAKLMTASVVLSNFGFVYDNYEKGVKSPVPFSVSAGFTKKFQHAPFRITLSLRDLQSFSLRYEEREDEDILSGLGDDHEKSRFDKISDEAIRHIAVGFEALFGKNFFIAAGYDFRAGKEMTIDSRFGGVGISWGMGFRVARYKISYGNKKYHLAGGTNFFTLNIDLNDFKSSKKSAEESIQ